MDYTNGFFENNYDVKNSECSCENNTDCVVEDKHELLIEKITKEIENFRDSYKALSVQQTYNDWYIIGFYEEYFEMLSSDFLDNRDAEKEIEWLITLNKPLAYLYEEWMSSDGSFSHNWDDMFDFIHEIYTLRSF